MHGTYQPGINHLFHFTNAITGTTLVAHLGNYLIAFSRFRKCARFENIVCKRFLNIYVFAQLHGRQSSYSVGIIRRGHRHGIDAVLFLIQHFPEIFIVLGIGKTFAGFFGLAVIYIAQENDVGIGAFGKFCQITCTLTADADTGNIQFIAGRNVSTAQYMAGYNKKSGCSQRCISKERTAGVVVFFVLLHIVSVRIW
jgi:hypothetical protein